MARALPIILVGNNLGERHKYLNNLVNEAHKKSEELDFNTLPEKSPIDRLFKINLASKLRNVDYIIQNLKDDDMLYVSRALKSKWLIEAKYKDIINPEYLEEKLYPEMITTAVNKMQHWIHLNLCDEERCKQFFQYYQETNFKFAIQFFLKCSKDDILNEFNKIIHRITPHYLKVLTEKSPELAKIFFDSISKDDEVKRLYLAKESAYFDTLRHILKTNPDFVLDITEKYFNKGVSKRFSAMQTKYIIKHQKGRFWMKPELYTGWLLNTQAVADSLNSDEAKDLVIKLAQAMYLTRWFNYQTIEPLIKRLKPEERAAFKKRVFVEKDIGDRVEEWSYEPPEAPARGIEYFPDIFDDRQPEPGEYNYLKTRDNNKRPIRKKKGRGDVYIMESCDTKETGKTLLDKLFNEFRFASFIKTLYELRKRIAAESSPKNREFMMFVLISKTGGRPDAVALLLELLERHSNEPTNVRAAVIRSLVKRAQVWRLPETSWDKLLKFGQGLGLDGKTADADCNEGLHAVVIRSLLQNGDCDSDIKNVFLTKFSTLTDYSLNSSEKEKIALALPKILFHLIKEKEEDTFVAVDCIEKLIKALETYKIKLETYPGLIDTIAMFADKKVSCVDHIIQRLFDAKIARKQLFRYTFNLIKSDDSYLNALKHDSTLLDAKKFAEYYDLLIQCPNKFFRKLSIYFNEVGGITSKYIQEIKAVQLLGIHGRPLAYMLSDQLMSYLNELDALEDLHSKLLASAIRANGNLARPSLDINALGWKKTGAKHVGNKLSKCRAVEIDNNVEELLKWKRTAKIAFALSKRTNYQTEVFVKYASIKSTSAMKSGLKFMKSQGDNVNPLIWETIKPIIQEFDITQTNRRFIVRRLAEIYAVPMKIRPEYSTVIYKSFLKMSVYDAMPSLCHVEILIPDVSEQFVENFITQFLQNDFTFDKLTNNENEIKCNCMYLRILIKYLLLCKNVEQQQRKYEKYFEPFLDIMDLLKDSDEKKELFYKYYLEMRLTLKYSKVFLNAHYVSPLPVIEKIIIWIRKHFTLDKHFKTFAKFHLLMLFYKAMEQAIKLVPDVFSDGNRRRTEGIEIFGKIFGKYMASEMNNLQKQYFETIPELYVHSVVSFLNNYNDYNLASNLLSSIIKGIFEENGGSTHRLGIYLMDKTRYDLSDEHFQNLVHHLNKLDKIELQWFVPAFCF